MPHPFPTGTQVAFNIEDLVLGAAVVAGAEFDDGWLYRLAAVVITRGDIDALRRLATESDDGVWVCEHEVRIQTPPGDNAGGAA